MTTPVITVGAFDRIGSRQIRFFQEASTSGPLDVILFEDALIEKTTGAAPKFPLSERQYFVENIRYVSRVHTISQLDRLKDIEVLVGYHPAGWISLQSEERPEYKDYAAGCEISYRVIPDESLTGYTEHSDDAGSSTGRKIIVTGCFDWFHTGHIRFFEEASEFGDLYVILGHDENLEKLKGPGHPMFPQQERRYIVGAIRFVKQALIATGHGWLDAEPEIQRLKPDGYVVNEDGDKQVKRDYCRDHGIEYIVLKRDPKPGLTRRTSTDLRGF